ncbi:MAG: anthranilate phosphoribosyltransferase [Verrucomicrobia bacterium]|nr:MAG: anthranilate phosphoribosyltransferase [Verrucomicrobiota bacterium]
MDLASLAASIDAGAELTPEQVRFAASQLAGSDAAPTAKEIFLESLARRGETPGEIAGFAVAFRELARDPGLGEWAPRAIDVCGTGGDKSGSFNISTVVGFVLAAAGVPVIKHGNRSITSKCGSADLLERLGIRLDVEGDRLRRSMEALNFVFLFAPAYHPAFREIVPVRKALAARGVRTVFNLLGPLLNPARPAHQIMGIFSEAFVGAAAGALDQLGLEAGYVVHSVDEEGHAYDELTACGRDIAVGFGRLRGTRIDAESEAFGVPRGRTADLAGGDVEANVRLLDEMLAGNGPRALVDSILLNAAAGLHAVGRVESIAAGIEPARELLTGGAVRSWLDRARAFYGE